MATANGARLKEMDVESLARLAENAAKECMNVLLAAYNAESPIEFLKNWKIQGNDVVWRKMIAPILAITESNLLQELKKFKYLSPRSDKAGASGNKRSETSEAQSILNLEVPSKIAKHHQTSSTEEHRRTPTPSNDHLTSPTFAGMPTPSESTRNTSSSDEHRHAPEALRDRSTLPAVTCHSSVVAPVTTCFTQSSALPIPSAPTARKRQTATFGGAQLKRDPTIVPLLEARRLKYLSLKRLLPESDKGNASDDGRKENSEAYSNVGRGTWSNIGKQRQTSSNKQSSREARKTVQVLTKEKEYLTIQAIRKICEDGLLVKVFSNKGQGVVADKTFIKGDFVVEYAGDLIDLKEAKQRDLKYAKDEATASRCFMYYFRHQDRSFCIDSTKESERLGRLINHSRYHANLSTKVFTVDDIPRLVFFARRDIQKGEELLYDYGDRSKESLANHQWLHF